MRRGRVGKKSADSPFPRNSSIVENYPVEQHDLASTRAACAVLHDTFMRVHTAAWTGHLRNRNDLTLWVGTCR